MDTIFSSTFGNILFPLINIALAGVSYWWWKKYKHKDYFRLFILWSILFVSKIVSYIFYDLVLPQLSGTSYLDTLQIFGTIRDAISGTIK